MEDSAGQTEAKISSLFTPPENMQEYSISTLVCDSEGTIYYKNDSCYVMAVVQGDGTQTSQDTPKQEQSGSVAGFTDVRENDWYASAVKLLSEKQLIKGTSATTFGPDANITRAEFVQILYNKTGAPQMTQAGGTPFADVSEGQWYASAVKWAYANNVASGEKTADGKLLFRPEDRISRQDMAVMLASFLEKIEKAELAEKNGAVTFADGGQIADYAQAAVAAMQKAGILSGEKQADGSWRFAPENSATRAEAASMLANYIK